MTLIWSRKARSGYSEPHLFGRPKMGRQMAGLLSRLFGAAKPNTSVAVSATKAPPAQTKPVVVRRLPPEEWDTTGWNPRIAEAQFPEKAPLEERWHVAKFVRPGGIGIELGVAGAGFSFSLLENSDLAYLYGADMYSDRKHDLDEYRRALKLVDKHRNRYSLIKMRFDEALPLFDDAYFDFIYVDGYAHTGEEGGRTFHDWWPKLKPGGVFAGDDYTPAWPLTREAVDRFAADKNLQVFVITPKTTGPFSLSPTWFAIKPQA
jgi:hypothetical protein